MLVRFQFLCLAVALALIGGSVDGQGGAATPGGAITRIRDVRALPDDALKARPAVRLNGVVLRYWTQGSSFILQDESDAIYVELARSSATGKAIPMRTSMDAGSVVEITGVATAGKFAPIVSVQDSTGIRVLGTAPLPAPLPLTAEAALGGRLDAHLVVVEGVVRRTRSRSASSPRSLGTQSLELVFDTTRLVVLLSGEDADWNSLINARIQVTGISSGIWNNRKQIAAPCLMQIARRDITVLRAAPAEPFAIPVRSVADIMRYRPEDAPGHRLRIAGTVLHALPDGQVFVFDSEKTARVECTTPSAVAVGDAVDAVGFPGMRERAPLLEDAVLRVRGHQATLPEAAPRQAASLLEQSHDYELVRMDAVLLETQRTKSGIDLLVQSGNRLFRAAFEGPGAPGFLPMLKPGTSLSLSGLVLFSFPSPTDAELRPNGFSLLLRSPSDVRIIRPPPGWTAQRMLWALLGALALIVGALAWGWMLRRRVIAQTILIADGVKRTATLEERTRLAREFHDTLEQELTGLALQLETAQATLPRAPEKTGPVLALLSRLARRCVEEAGHAVLDLRSSALETGDLPAALRAATAAAFAGKDTAVSFTLEGESRRLPPRIEHALLRVAQEAATNAAKHARAARFETVLRIETGRVTLRLADDGCGFIPESSLTVGQFGLLGMKERVEKISGRFELNSQPGAGTRIQITVPLNSTSA